MNHFRNILLSLTLMGAASCTHELPTSAESEQGTVLQISSGQSITSANAASRVGEEPSTKAERSYTSLDIYYYNSADGAQVAHQRETTAGEYPFRVAIPEQVTELPSVIIVAASSPALTGGGSMPDAIALSDLETLISTGMSSGGRLLYPDTEVGIPMAGKTTATYIGAVGIVPLKLTRTVAKIRVKVEDKVADSNIKLDFTKMTMSLKNLRTQVPLFSQPAGDLTPAYGLFTSQNLTPDMGNTYVAYVNEHLFDQTASLPTDLATILLNVPIDLTKNGITERLNNNSYTVPVKVPLQRNYIYNITIKIVGPGADTTPVIDVETRTIPT